MRLVPFLLFGCAPFVGCQQLLFSSQHNSLVPWGNDEDAEPSQHFIVSSFATELPEAFAYSRLATRRPTVVKIAPRGGDTEGNITIVVIGGGFVDYGDVKCRFGSTSVHGQVLHDRAISCPVPPRSALLEAPGSSGRLAPSLPASCKLHVSLNGVDFVGSSNAVFWYFNRSRVLLASIRPSGGPPAGGTQVTVSGVGFEDFGGGLQGLKCRFGDESPVAATLVTQEEVHCISPPQVVGAPHSTPVWLTLNGYADDRGVSGGNLNFRYGQRPGLTRLHPLGDLGGPQSLVTITGSGFENAAERRGACPDDPASTLCVRYRALVDVRTPQDASPMCLFGDPAVVTRATVADENTVLCRAPPRSSLSGAAPLSPACKQFAYTIQCDDPAYTQAGVLAVVLRVTLNGNQSDASEPGLPWMLMPMELPRVDYVTPWVGPETGGTNVSVVGTGLLFFGQTLCRFDHVKVPAVVGGARWVRNGQHAPVGSSALEGLPLVTTVTMHDGRTSPVVAREAGELLTCASPPGHLFGSRYVSLSISLDGVHFSLVSTTFRYADVRPLELYPTGGPHIGGTTITVRRSGGTLPTAGVRCVFGAQSVPATITSSLHLRCISPPVPEAALVDVRITLHGDDALADTESTKFQFYGSGLEGGITVSSITPAAGPEGGSTPVTLRGEGFGLFGTPRCRFGGLAPTNASLHPEANGTHGTELLVCHAPPRALSDGVLTETVSLAITLNGQQYHGGYSYTYAALCAGRDRLEYYAPDAHRQILRYLRASSPATQYDADGDGRLSILEVEAAIQYQISNSSSGTSGYQPTSAELSALAESTCFEEGTPGRTFARLDDRRSRSDLRSS